jgi:hypothetical protein
VLGEPGLPLDAPTRAFMEPRFEQDFSAVRVHHDGRAAESARAVGARAYTVGQHLVFGAGQYQPHARAGRHLIAHELTHVIQQSRMAPLQTLTLADADDPAEAEAERMSHQVGDGRPASPIRQQPGAARLQRAPGPDDEQDNASPPLHIPWRGSFEDSYIAFALAAGVDPETAKRVAKEAIKRHSGWVAGKQRFATDEEAAKYIDSQPDPGFILRFEINEFMRQELGLPQGRLEKTAALLEQQQSALKETQKRSVQPQKAFKADYTVLKDARLAKLCLEIVEHYTTYAVTTADWMERASNGLSADEVADLIALDLRIRIVVDLFTQGWREFRAANGKAIDKFQPLVRTVIEQYLRGNPNAVANQLRIGYGEPGWNMLGIAHRPTNQIWYDQLGNPLEGLSGLGFRDKGFRGAAPPQWAQEHGVEIDDPAVRLFLDILRQEFGDPALIIAEAAQVYFDNIELVNSRVQSKLDQQIRDQFVDSLPFVIGFLAGHGVSWLLMRMAHPAAVAAGLALQGLLRAAGYLLAIETSVGALERLLEAARHLIQVKKNDSGQFTILSQGELDKAADILRVIVADIAITVGTLSLGKLLRSGKRLRLSCTRCRISSSMIDSAGNLTPEGVAHLRKKFPKRFAGESDAAIRDAFARDVTVDRKGVLLEELVLEEIEQTHRAAKATGSASKTFFVRGKTLNSLLAEIESRASSTVRNKAILEQKAGDFAASDPVLQKEIQRLDKHPNETARAVWKQWFSTFKEGIVGEKKPDAVEVFLDRDLAQITDPTLAVTSEFGPTHAFKTLFYKRVLEVSTTLDVGSLEVAPGLFSLVGD